MVMRDKFDHFLVKAAIEAGCCLCEETSFMSLSGVAGNLCVNTTKGQFRTKILVGADGVNSRTAKSLSLQGQRHIMRAIEAEVFYKDPKIIRQLKHTAHFELGVIPKGYGWIFPKKDHLSIGVVTTSRKVRHLMHYLNVFMKTKGLYSPAKKMSVKGHIIPYNPSKKNKFANQKGLLVGDAAGFTDPITGEGIYYAVIEAIVSARIILKSLEQDYGSMEIYNRAIKRVLMKEMVYAQRLGTFIYAFTNYNNRILNKFWKELGRRHVQIVYGKSTYRMLYFQLLNFPRIIWKIVRTFFHPLKAKSRF
jgi:flavin-dependent dehydrogenase